MNSTPSRSLFGRALLAVVLMIGFYALAVVIVLGLLWLLRLQFTETRHVSLKLVFVCVAGAGTILWSICPRIDRFEPPGPELDRARHPQLFTEIEDIARRVNQAVPAVVYLVPDINAWVSERGGIMGIGSRRVMGLGLPLLRVLTRSEFRAVLAHEFGHFHSGDTRLGPWIFKTRGAIGRTLDNLGSQGSLLQLPFLWYGKMFLRVTQAVSRRQEFVADELAAGVVGARPLGSGLRKVHGIGPAFQAYWSGECLPVLGAGFRPPLVEGFEAFVRVTEIARAIEQHVEDELESAKADPYDTHPPLRERLAAVAALPAGETPAEDPAALTMLGEVGDLEQSLLVAIAGSENASTLKPVAWADVGTRVYVPRWRELAAANGAALSGLTPESLTAAGCQDAEFLGRFVSLSGKSPDASQRLDLAEAVIGSALVLAVLALGGELSAGPGEKVTVRRAGEALEPFGVVGALARSELGDATWLSRVDALGLRGVDLGAA